MFAVGLELIGDIAISWENLDGYDIVNNQLQTISCPL